MKFHAYTYSYTKLTPTVALNQFRGKQDIVPQESACPLGLG